MAMDERSANLIDANINDFAAQLMAEIAIALGSMRLTLNEHGGGPVSCRCKCETEIDSSIHDRN